MKRRFVGIISSLLMLVPLSGCTAIEGRMASISIIYAATAVLSLLLLLGYCFLLHKREFWFVLLFSSVFVVNSGYFALSISKTLETALFANRVAYLGSVFLPLSMLMIIMDTCRLRRQKWLSILLLSVGVLVFLVAASPGYLDIYYEQVSLEIKSGVALLVKEYGPWHTLYLFYLLAYFSAMLGTITYASVKQRIASNKHAIILLVAVFVNIGVWLLEQLVKMDFEFLAISYIISELFLISLYLMLQECGFLSEPVKAQTAKEDLSLSTEAQSPVSCSDDNALTRKEAPMISAQRERFEAQVKKLTPTERKIFDFYLSEKTTKEIMQALQITQNTLKYHNKNIYGKFGVSSRKQLLAITAELEQSNKTGS